MDFNTIKETETLIPKTNNNNDNHNDNDNDDYYKTGVTTVKVVEYMLQSMSNELLHKFPDNSAFDFDYTQSSIWSPLVPHPSKPSSPVLGLRQGKVLFDEAEEAGDGTEMKFHSCMFNCFKIDKEFDGKRVLGMKRRRNRGFGELGVIGLDSGDAGVDSGCSSSIRVKKQGWKKVLKAASKQFKKTMKKKDSGVHLKISSNANMDRSSKRGRFVKID